MRTTTMKDSHAIDVKTHPRIGPRRALPWREGARRVWWTMGALTLVLMVTDCSRTSAEFEGGLHDMGGGLVLKPDGTVVDAFSLSGEVGVPELEGAPGVREGWIPDERFLTPLDRERRRSGLSEILF